MLLLDLSLPRPSQNLALDEALLHEVEQGVVAGDVLRLWEFSSYVVVLGRGGRVSDEVHRAACLEDNIPILRRTSGGGTIVGGPGCLMYSLVLSRDQFMADGIMEITAFILERMASGLARIAPNTCRAGISDLCLAEKSTHDGTILHRKFSGNSMRLRPTHVLFHGTILYDFDLSLIGRYLKLPERQPDYRQQRAHGDFITNLSADCEAIKQSLVAQWRASMAMRTWPVDLTEQLARSKYEDPDWNLRF